MILQRDRRLNSNIQKYGCYFMSILWHINRLRNIALDDSVIESFYEEAVRLGYMGETCWIRDPDGIFALGGLQTKYTQEHAPSTRVCADDEIEILKWVHPDGSPRSHFVAGDGLGNTTYDPWGVSRAATEGRLESKRIFKLV